MRADITGVIGEPLLDRLLSGSRTHAARRVDEMQAAAAYVEELGIEPRIAEAAAQWRICCAPRRLRPTRPLSRPRP